MDRPSRITPRDLEHMLCDETADPKALPLSLLEQITDDFSDEHRIGIGGFAVVYKGKLENRNVAVKRMSNTYKYEKEFQREVECLMMVKHRNVVRFLGYCADTQGSVARHEGRFVMADVQQRLLCFEYLPKGSLDEYITGTTGGLQWRDRYHIIKGICQGLQYLHHRNIVHLDLKPGNILLDGNLVAKIADFGLSRCFDVMQSRIITLNIDGTFGYLAPEFGNGEITYKLDIYSLGVLIIEILTGKKGYHAVDKIVERWSNRLDESKVEVQLEQVRVCSEIGIECTNFNPEKRPDTQHIICRLDETESMDRYIETAVITSRQNSPDMLIGTMHALWLSYQQLNPNIRRCIEFCSIFPIASKLKKDELAHLWIAQGFVQTSCATEDIEDIAEGYIQELESISFLQPIGSSSGTDCYKIHDVLHDILDKVVGNCFRIDNARSHVGEGWQGDVPRHIQHLFIQNYDGELITETIIGLEHLRTLIVYVVEKGAPVEERVIESICKRLPKLRVLAIAFSQEHFRIEKPNSFSVPESIGQLKYLRYLSFKMQDICWITLPSTLNNLQYIQLLDFGEGNILGFTFAELVNLRHIFCRERVHFPYVGRLSSLQTLRAFEVSYLPGCELKQLRDLNKLRGKLHITGLANVKSRGQALEANLAAKRLTEITLQWGSTHGIICSPEVQADVVQGLCPPMGLKILELCRFNGRSYPDWMVNKQSGGPRNLQQLHFGSCGQLVPPSGLAEAFPHLRVLHIRHCSWDALPRNMEYLTSLKELRISFCNNIRSLPTLPQYLERFILFCGDRELHKSCKTVGHLNWQKIEHIPDKKLVDHLDAVAGVVFHVSMSQQMRRIQAKRNEVPGLLVQNVKLL